MKSFRIFLVALLLQHSAAFGGDWISLGRSATSSGQGFESAYHPDTVKSGQFPLVQVWFRQVFDQDQTNERVSYRSIIWEVELNCTDWWTFGVLDARLYGANERSVGQRQRMPHQKIEVNSQIDKLAKTLCRKGDLPSLPAEPEKRKSEKAGPNSSGSGVFVTPDGYVLTNNHVIEGCSSLKGRTARGQIDLTLFRQDQIFDLAVLKTNSTPSDFARFRNHPGVSLGETVIAVGFPLHGILASDINVSTGIVSALAGLRNDAARLQITAPVQPGSSGGPLLDLNGDLVGVVVSQLKPSAAQNVNFAIKGELATIFLQTHGIAVSKSTSKKKIEVSQIAQRAREYTIVVECY